MSRYWTKDQAITTLKDTPLEAVARVFPHATYFDCESTARLVHETLDEAVESYLDSEAEVNEDPVVTAQRVGEVRVEVWRRWPKPNSASVEHMVETFLERAEEWWHENYGDPDDDSESKFDRSTFEQPIAMLLSMFLAQREPWQCEHLGTLELSVEEVVALLDLKHDGLAFLRPELRDEVERQMLDRVLTLERLSLGSTAERSYIAVDQIQGFRDAIGHEFVAWPDPSSPGICNTCNEPRSRHRE